MPSISGLSDNRVGKIQAPINKFLTEDGLGMPAETGIGTGGNYRAIGDYSASTKAFFWICPTAAMAGMDLIARLDTLTVVIKDDNSFDSGRYGSQGAGQEFTGIEGISIKIKDALSTTINDITQGVSIKSSTDWDRFSLTQIERQNWGSGDEVVGFSRELKHPMRLQAGQMMVFELNGDFSHLTDHYFLIGGVFENVWH